MSTVVSNKVSQGRFGFHPCSYEEFLELKQAHKVALEALRVGLRYHRWVRKDPDNRKGAEPPLPKSTWVDADFGCHDFKRFYLQLLAAYRNARYPKPTIEEVQFVEPPRNWKQVIANLQGK